MLNPSIIHYAWVYKHVDFEIIMSLQLFCESTMHGSRVGPDTTMHVNIVANIMCMA